jgi:hypothetical protein
VAIQFKCPECDAAIRVPDTSAGKKGTCPQCAEKLIVPSIALGTDAVISATIAPPSRSGAANVDGTHRGTPHIDLSTKKSGVHPGNAAGNRVRMDDSQDDAPFTGLGMQLIDEDEEASLVHKSTSKGKYRKQNRSYGWTVPVFCISVLIGVLGTFYLNSQPKLNAKLTAQAAPDTQPRTGFISGDLSGLQPDDLNEVLQALKAAPAEWSSPSTVISLTGTDEGVSVTIKPGTSSQLVVVQPAQNKNFADFVQQYGDQLEKPRLAEIQKNAPKLFADWLKHFAQNAPMVNQSAHCEGVIFPSLVTGVGYHLEAATKGIIYPCVFEDDGGGFYFLLPMDTKSFALRGRKIPGSVSFPVSFTVVVDSADDPSGPAQKKSRSKSLKELEEENQGMNPELEQVDQDSDGSTPSNSTADALKNGLGNVLAPDGKPSQGKPKLPRQTKMEMMGDEDMSGEGMPGEAMPGKPKPKSKSAVKSMPLKDGMMSDEMMDDKMMLDGEMSGDEMPNQPKSKSKSAAKSIPPKSGSAKSGMMQDDADEMIRKPKPKK